MKLCPTHLSLPNTQVSFCIVFVFVSFEKANISLVTLKDAYINLKFVKNVAKYKLFKIG